LAVILAVVVGALALGDGWFSSSEGTAESNAFVASDARKSALVWAVGDGPDGQADARRVARLITRSKPDRVLFLGDVYESGTATEFAQNYDSIYGKIAKRIAPTPGNHDWPQRTGGYDAYWQSKLGRSIRYYYSFKTAGWEILSLNSEMDHDAGSPQVAWLRAKAGKGTCRIAFWHRPRYSAGDHHGDDPSFQPFWDALKGHATIVLNGHEHDMQRFKPRDGITEFISGAGGHDLYAVHPRADLAFANNDKFGALRLVLSRGLARYRFVSVQGRTLDAGKVRCRPA